MPKVRGSRPGMMTVSEAVIHTGLSMNTVRRRVDAWDSGDRSPYALKGGRSGGGERLVDRLDAERVRLQRVGDVASAVTTEQWRGLLAAGKVPLSVTKEPWFAALLEGLPPPF